MNATRENSKHYSIVYFSSQQKLTQEKNDILLGLSNNSMYITVFLENNVSVLSYIVISRFQKIYQATLLEVLVVYCTCLIAVSVSKVLWLKVIHVSYNIPVVSLGGNVSAKHDFK